MLPTPYLEQYQHLDYIQENEEPSLQNLADESALLRQLRRHKYYWQVRYVQAWLRQELNQESFLIKISALAERLIQCALDWQFEALAQRYGRPAFNATVLAMGKLGGGELNFSSDVDLILTYREAGEALRGEKSTDYALFFQKLAQKLVASLENRTADGFVYRVDLRLRPFGQSGALALPHAAMEQYYSIHGRDWERYALMKARPIAGDIEGGKRLLRQLRPFIYRRYLDYQALQALSEMKQSINQQMKEEGKRHLKLGVGGIREAEFAVQAMQMVYGGQYPSLQNTSFLQVLQQLAALNLWSQETVQDLRAAYLQLRSMENALQFYREEQTHVVPESEDESAWLWLAGACHAPNIATLKQDWRTAQNIIHQHFKALFAQQGQAEAPPQERIDWRAPELALRALNVAEDQITRWQQFAQRLPWSRLPQDSLKHLQQILPQLLHAPDAASLEALLQLLEQVVRRAAYLYLLAAHPALIHHLLALAHRSRWLMQFICKHPMVLDDVLNPRPLPDLSALDDDLNARLQHLDGEAFAHALRDFKNLHTFKTAWQDVHQALPLMQVSDRLSHIAERVLQHILAQARRDLIPKHGLPRHSSGREALFAVVAYGKLGGFELGYGSDLDLIFLYDDGEGGQTDGAKPLDNQVFFTRLAQRMLHLLSFNSTNGILYQSDTRLRPNGQSGLLISHIKRFEAYQLQEAQTWEHQALTRARCVAGDAALFPIIHAIRDRILRQERDEALLRTEVCAMRQKMREAFPDANDVKHGAGGLIDIEFMVQYLILRHAHAEPTLTRMSDNIRQLAGLEALGILNSSDAMTLRDAYRQLRALQHHHYLNQEQASMNDEALRERVLAIQMTVFNNASTERTPPPPPAA